MFNLNKNKKGSGWWEKRNVITGVAPIHSEVANRQHLEKEGLLNSLVSIRPKEKIETIPLHFKIEKADINEFIQATKDFCKENSINRIQIFETDKKDVLEAIVPVDYAIDYPLFLIQRKSKFGLCKL